MFTECDRYKNGRPSDLTNELEAKATRKYLIIIIMKKLWEEEKEEGRSGANRTRVRDGSRRSRKRQNRQSCGTVAGTAITATGPVG